MTAITNFKNLPAWGFQTDRCNAEAQFNEGQQVRDHDKSMKLQGYIPFYGAHVGCLRLKWVAEHPKMSYVLAHTIRGIFEIALNIVGAGCLLAIPDLLMTGYREGVAMYTAWKNKKADPKPEAA